MPKPSDILAVRMLILHVWTKLDGCRDVQNCEHLQRHGVQLMSVAARMCVSVIQRQETDTNLSQNCFTKLILGSHSTKLERTFVCKYEIGTSHILGTWLFAGSNTLGGSLSLQPFSIARPDDGGAAKPLLLSNAMALVLSGRGWMFTCCPQARIRAWIH